MLVTVQFPIADARPFVTREQLRSPLPDWPDLKTTINPQFVHHFGRARERVGEPDEAWPDEAKFVLARRGLRFDRLETRHAGFPNRRFRPRCAFRRLFCDGAAVVRAEVGIANQHKAYPLYDLAIGEVLTIARQIAEVPTRVPGLTGEMRLRPILAQGRDLARLYAHASMNRAAAEQSLGLKLVEAADPLLVVELRQDEAHLKVEGPIAEGLTIVDQECINGAKALYGRLTTKTGIVAIWILQKGDATIGQLRSLRLCLTRLHAEREVLDLTLKQIHRRRLLNPPSEESANLLDDYFNSRLKIVNRETWGGMLQSEIVASFDATLAVVRPASQAELISRYEGCRQQVWKKIEAYQEKRRATRSVTTITVEKGGTVVEKKVNVIGTGNIVNVAEYMSNVTSTVNNHLAESNADAEVKGLIKQLNQELERVAPRTDPVSTKKMGKNLEALSREAASDEPERRWYEVSLEGIKEAAEAMGAIAKPILGIVAKLSALLLA